VYSDITVARVGTSIGSAVFALLTSLYNTQTTHNYDIRRIRAFHRVK